MTTLSTPFFPAFRPRLAPLKASLLDIRSKPLPYLHQLFSSWIPAQALQQERRGPNSRERIFSIELTFWAFLSQILSPGMSCREALRQVLSLYSLHKQGSLDEQNSGYCQARDRLPLARLQQILGMTAHNARQRVPKSSLWRGREIKVVDGSSVSMPDTAKNQEVFPQQRGQKPGCGFPIMKFVGIFSISTGCLLHVVTGNFYCGELALFRKLWHLLKAGDILLADRHYSDYGSLAILKDKGVDAVVRMHQGRSRDFRQGTRLGPDDRLITWEKPVNRTKTLSKREHKSLPSTLTLRMIRVRCASKGFRTRELILVTTLLDAEKYPASEIAQLYLQRWNVELFFRDIKTMLKMETLRCKSPEMVTKELFMHLIAYNLIRTVMLESARKYDVDLERLSFKGTLDSVRQYSLAIARTRTKARAAELVKDLLRVLAKDLVPKRPGRQEPRALKRRPKPYSLLNRHRKDFKEIPHRHKYKKSNKANVNN